MNETKINATYDTETVRVILNLPRVEDVRNLARPGKPLHSALVRAAGGPRGRYDVRKVRKVRAQMIRRRLAERLGRSNPRFLQDSHSRACPECGGIAVAWAGTVLCEDGHKAEDIQEDGEE